MEHLQRGDEVRVSITPIYNNESLRPGSFNIRYKIGNDSWFDERFNNVSGGK
ncbi:DNA/RNA non-specific endonuclease [Shouchella miscanthi]|uniref:DNA/RNA non-specific endonuclease n=1 Tax=Shouchella miscanthi TaxID=2598861 RepID=UPI002482741A|nr:DNA/RNA non-specific endonuclease [Shouchella miscanthi]